MKYSIFMLFLWGFFSCSCNENTTRCGLVDFSQVTTLVVEDSIDLEALDILNPHYIFHKDSFLIFNSIQGRKEIQLLNLSNSQVHEFNVIGQGPNEMINYQSVINGNDGNYMFADISKGKIYEISLDSLKNNDKTNYNLKLSLPNQQGYFLLRYIDLPDYIIGIGMLNEKRLWVYNKKTSTVKEQIEYPENELISPLSSMHKGALFSRTLLASNKDGNKLAVASFGLIDFLDLPKDGNLMLTKSNHYHFPLFNVGDIGGPAIVNKKEDKAGIIGLCSDDDYVYGLYSNKTIDEYGIEGAYHASFILVWDWDGNPIKSFWLSMPLYGFSISGDIIYGLSRIKEPKVYTFRIK